MRETIKVLMIEDSEPDAELILNTLSEAKLSVKHCLVDNANDMKKQLEEHEWDIILCDYAMPSFSPFEAIEILKKLNIFIPFIVISGKIGEEKAVELMKSGCRDCIMKHNMNRIPAVVIREIEEAKIRKENIYFKTQMNKYQLLADKAGDAMLVIDLEGNILDVNNAAVRAYGYSYEEFQKMNLTDLGNHEFFEFISDRKILISEQIQAIQKEVNIYETVHYKKDNTAVNVEVSSNTTMLEDNLVLLCIVRDITDRKKIESDLRGTKEYLEKLINYANAPIIVWDDKFRITRYNGAFELLTGRKADEVLGKNLKILFLPHQIRNLRRLLKNISERTNLKNEEIEIIHKDGSVRIVLWNSAVIYDEDGIKLISTIAQGQDITDRKKAEERLFYMGYHDQLTGLYNRRFFEDELKRLDNQKYLPLSIIMGDINGLKIINDSFGHAVGDEILRKAAEIFMKASRADDIVFRMGGDEFAVILPKTDSAESQQIINCINDMASDTKVANIELSVSLGYDTKEKDKQTISDMLANAENDMYRHKLYERSSMRSKTIDIIMNTLFEKSNRESLHSKRVSEICQIIASEMHLDKDEEGQIRIAGLVHDIGKIGIDEKILNKTGKLSDDEMTDIKKHPEIGWRILNSINEFSELANYVIAHHEKWDGSGYPKGLKGEEIPLQARIITVADAYDAMTSERSYRKSLSKEKVIEELEKCSGTQFDPQIIDIFLNRILPYYSIL